MPIFKSRRQFLGLLFLCLLTGLLFHYLFYGKMVGVSNSIFMVWLYGLYFLKLDMSIKGQSLFEWILFISCLLLSIAITVYSNYFLLSLNILAIPLIFIAHTSSHARFFYNEWRGQQFISSMFAVIQDTFHYFFRSFQIGGTSLKARVNEQSYNVLKKIFLGLLVSAPLLCVVVVLLSSADRQFASILESIPLFLSRLSMGDFSGRIILILGVSFVTFAYLLALSRPLKIPSNRMEERKGSIDSIIMSTVLLLTNIIYALFVYVQFSYLFGGNPAGGEIGYTYAEYARKGFGELTLVTIINFGILLVTINFMKYAGRGWTIFIKLLQTCLVSFTVFMLASAYYRLSLYEEAYGYTHARIFAHAFMILLFVFLILAYFKVWIKRLNLSKNYILVAVVFYVGLNYMNVDRLIARQNLERYDMTGKLDTYYMSMLSSDAVPEIISYSKTHEKNEMLEKLLLDKYFQLRKSDNPWQAFNYSRYQAEKMLSEYLE